MRISNINKSYTNGFVMNIEDFVLKGKIIGLLGHVGSGKTTLLKAICKINYINSLVVEGDFRYMIEYDKLPNSTIKKLADLYSCTQTNYNMKKLDELMKLFKISYEDNISELSEGQKKIISFVLTMSMNTDVLLLDEPLSKIDPYNRKLIINTIIDAIETYKHIIIASHEISNLERIIEYVVLIKDGKILRGLWKAISRLWSRDDWDNMLEIAELEKSLIGSKAT